MTFERGDGVGLEMAELNVGCEGIFCSRAGVGGWTRSLQYLKNRLRLSRLTLFQMDQLKWKIFLPSVLCSDPPAPYVISNCFRKAASWHAGISFVHRETRMRTAVKFSRTVVLFMGSVVGSMSRRDSCRIVICSSFDDRMQKGRRKDKCVCEGESRIYELGCKL